MGKQIEEVKKLALDFVTSQACGEWDDKTVQTDAGLLADRIMDYLTSRTTPTPPAGQVEAVADALYKNWPRMDIQSGQRKKMLDFSELSEEEKQNWYRDAQSAIKASGAEHIAGLIGALEDIIAEASDLTEYEVAVAKKALEALPPELRGK